VIEITKTVLNGYLPYYVEVYHDKIASIIRILSQT